MERQNGVVDEDVEGVGGHVDCGCGDDLVVGLLLLLLGRTE